MNINDYIGGELEFTNLNNATLRGTIENYKTDAFFDNPTIILQPVFYLHDNKWRYHAAIDLVPLPNLLQGIALNPTTFQVIHNEIRFTFYHPTHPEHLTEHGITIKKPQPAPKYRSIDAKD